MDYNVKTLSDEKFLKELEKKLRDEVDEYLESKSAEELADIIEVIERISELKGITKEQIDELKFKKSEEKGAFQKNLFLIDTKLE